MIRTSVRDKNYFSIYNGETNLNGELNVPIPKDLRISNSLTWSSVFKVTGGTKNTQYNGIKISQGNECVLDVANKCENLVFDCEYGEDDQVGDQVNSTKGGCKNIVYKGLVRSRGRRSDWVIGRWDDETYNITEGIDLKELKHNDGQPIRVVIAHAKNVQLGPNCKVQFWWSLGETIYWWGKWILVKTLFKWFPRLNQYVTT